MIEPTDDARIRSAQALADAFADYRRDLAIILAGVVPRPRYWPSEPPPLLPLRKGEGK